MSYSTRLNSWTIVVVAGLAASLTTTTQAGQTVFLDFGAVGTTTTKADQNIFNADGTVLITMKKGARAGYTPTELGYPNNDNRAAQIQAIVAQVTADYADGGNPYNITFVTTQPASGEYSTIHVTGGTFPNFNIKADDGNDVRIDQATNRGTITGGPLNGYYVDLTTGQLHRANGTAVDGATYPELAGLGALGPDAVGGIAQQIDKGNKDKGKAGWVFVGGYGSIGGLNSDQKRTELANGISHELAHLLGLEHDDGTGSSIMSHPHDGGDVGFGNDEKKKLAAVLAPKNAQAVPRERDAKSGDKDQHGSSKTDQPATGDPDQDAANKVKKMRAALQSHTADPPYNLPIQDVRQTGTGDGEFTDVMLPNGTQAVIPLQLGQPGVSGTVYGAWVELRMMNVADVLGGPQDLRVFIDGVEFPGALDGVDQRISNPVFAGYARSDMITLHLTDLFTPAQLQSVLADGQIVLTVQVAGATPAISIDSVDLIVVDQVAAAVPSLSEWGLIIFGATLLFTGVVVLRSRA